MGRLFLEHLGGSRLFSCANCDTFLTNRGELVSTRFTGATGRAFLFNKVVNLELSEVQDRIMLTGRHMVRDVSCKKCKTKLGWMYEFATDESQKYKEGRVILVDADQLEKLASQAGMELGEYSTLTEQALTCTGNNSGKYELDIAHADFTICLTWRKLLDEGTKYVLGRLSFSALNNEDQRNAVCEVMQYSVDSIGELAERAIFAEQEGRRLGSNRLDADRKANEAIDAKNDFEKKIFDQFSELLNAKKAKIVELQQQVEKLESERDAAPSSSKVNGLNESKSPSKFSDNQDAEDSGEDTDEEKERLNAQREEAALKRQKTNEEKKQELEEEEEEEEDIHFVPKRKRGRPRKDGTAINSPRVKPTYSYSKKSKGKSKGKASSSTEDSTPELTKSLSKASGRSTRNSLSAGMTDNSILDKLT